MNYFKQFYHLALISWLFIFPCCTSVNKTVLNSKTSTTFYSVNDFAAVEKFDTHVHLNTYDTPFINQARSDNFRLLDIVDERPFGIPMQEQEKIAILQSRSFPGEVIYATTFSVKNWGKVRWQQDAIDSLKQSFQNGAIAVKVWKNIGMELKDKNGNFIMIDDPSFDPILGYLEKNNITLIGHLGEPRECWLPLEQMVLHRSYYGQHPEYHMYLHPEYPSYESQIQARDHMLEKHPGLRFVGAHLGSLEWSLEELAKRLDKYPNMAVDLARMSNLFLHAKNNWQTTHDFFINYQDRLLYATDVQVEQSKDEEAMKKRVHDSRRRYWTFFATNEWMNEPGSVGKFKGLNLPRDVVDKIYRKNAEKWFPGIVKDEKMRKKLKAELISGN